MLAYEPPLNPPCHEWEQYILPALCKERIHDICSDIIRKGEKTVYQDIYDAIYEIVESYIQTEKYEACYD